MSKVVFRVDASLQIGSGHVMRCLTLANALTARGAECIFISRSHAGNLHALVRQRGFAVLELPGSEEQLAQTTLSHTPAHASWLGCSWETDARQTHALIHPIHPDWLIVDHYALAAPWEAAVRQACGRLMAIDDLADREHICDLLLDQNLGRSGQDYVGKVPATCKVLAGSRFALLAPQFAALRAESLQRRRTPLLRNILVTMGGVDQHNATLQVLTALNAIALPQGCTLTIVMGQQSAWLASVREYAAHMACGAEVLVNIGDMAQRMLACDLAVGAAGSTAWERCCLGVPSLMVVLADNQRSAAMELERAGAAVTVSLGAPLRAQVEQFLGLFGGDAAPVSTMIRNASSLVDGLGAQRVLDLLVNFDSGVSCENE